MLIFSQCLIITTWLLLSAMLIEGNVTQSVLIAESHGYHKILQHGFTATALHRSQSLQSQMNQFLNPFEENSNLPKMDALYNLLDKKLSTVLYEVAEQHNSTRPCMQALEKLIIDGVKNHKGWALKMLDASAKLPSGISLLDFTWTGSYDLCKNITAYVNYTGQNITSKLQGRYCNAYFNLQSAASVGNGSLFGQLLLSVGLCVPDACDALDLNILAHEALQLLPLGNNTSFFKGIACTEVKYEATVETVVAIIFGVLIAILIILGTLWDEFIHKYPMYNPQPLTDNAAERESPMNADQADLINSISYSDNTNLLGDERRLITLTIKHRPRVDGIFSRILLAFSLSTNGRKLLDTTTGRETVLAVNGIRVLSMAWVILGHTYFFGMAGTRNISALLEMTQRFTFQAVMNGAYAVDSFFFLSGLLVAYLTLKEMKKTAGKLNWLKFYVHRFLRLTPAYMLIILTYTAFFQYWGNGPLWPEHSVDYKNCKNYWWRNLLYINNFFPTAESCIGWSWYLANDMQMFWISPLILFPLYRKPVIGYLILGSLMLMQFLYRGFISVKYQLVLGGPDLAHQGDWFDNVYVRPYARIGPYLVGILTGYLLVKTDRNIHIPKPVVLAGWAVSFTCILALTYGTDAEKHGHINSIYVDAVYNSVCKVVWSGALAWIVFACNTGHGGLVTSLLSWNVWGPLGRLTYCAYLIHPIMMYAYILSQRYPVYYMDITAIYMFLGHWCLTYGVAFLASLVFESPIIGLEKILLRKKT